MLRVWQAFRDHAGIFTGNGSALEHERDSCFAAVLGVATAFRKSRRVQSHRREGRGGHPDHISTQKRVLLWINSQRSLERASGQSISQPFESQ